MSKECCTNESNPQGDHSSFVKSNTSVWYDKLRMFFPAIVALVLLLSGLYFDYYLKPEWFIGWWRFIWYILAYIPVVFPVLIDAFESIRKGDFFSEFLLMSIATIGAFAIQEYPEAVAVMLFYAIGEAFQDIAVKNAKRNIQILLDQRPDQTNIIKNNEIIAINAKDVSIGDIVQLKLGEKLALDGILLSDSSSFNTAALTGESKPDTKRTGERVLAGMINLDKVCLIEVTHAYEDSKLSKILELVQQATEQKAPTELFIRKFARIYTPIVVLLAVGICTIPYFFTDDYVFAVWLYRALVFLVISCPCALVISIPLGYFGGIGAASRNGILFKGSNYLDLLASVRAVVMDKTGTITEGVFEVQDVCFSSEFDKIQILNYVNSLETLSSHPIASAIHAYIGSIDSTIVLKDTLEIPGYGLRTIIDDKELLVGNFKLLDKYNILYTIDPSTIVYTTIAVAYGGVFVGYITIADRIKEDAAYTIRTLHSYGIHTVMLSGDKSNVVEDVAQRLHIDESYGDLLPEDKVGKFKAIKADRDSVAFVGDGINDAPVIALSDVGIAMGGLGADATIETADVVIQDDKPSKIVTAIQIGKETKKIVWQNIILAFGVKAIVLILGAGGLATMWEAVFADVGVAFLAILNAIRIQKMRFK